jgi:PAS domain S-box-containing protein
MDASRYDFPAPLALIQASLADNHRLAPDLEAKRLAALHRYELLDTPPEAEFDGLASLAADLLDAPVALVSLIDDKRQWFKARIGLDLTETPRSWSFCEHVLWEAAGSVLVVPDAACDPRFAANPLVTGGPRIRFYAGAPLLTPEGVVLGSLCVLSPDGRPKGLGVAERRRLTDLAALVARGFELRSTARQAARLASEAEARQAGEERLRLSLEIARACAWEFDPRSGMSLWDPAAHALFGMPEKIAFNDAMDRLVHPEDLGQVRAAILQAIDPAGSGSYAVEHRAALTGPDGRPRWLRSLGQAWFAADSQDACRPTRLVCVTMDITEQQFAVERQALLVAELNHRVKNTLAVVQSIAEQTRRATSSAFDGQPSRFHKAFRDRLLALAKTHDLLTVGAWQGATLADLVNASLRPFTAPPAAGAELRIDVAGPVVRFPPEPAVTLALALHEMASNAARFGALSSPLGRVRVAWQVSDSPAVVELCWTEQGGPPVAGPPTHCGFGTRLLERGLGHQLKGSVELKYAPEGLCIRLRVPIGRAMASVA